MCVPVCVCVCVCLHRYGYPVIETVIVVILSLIGLVPLAVIRSSSTDVVYMFGLLGTGTCSQTILARTPLKTNTHSKQSPDSTATADSTNTAGSTGT